MGSEVDPDSGEDLAAAVDRPVPGDRAPGDVTVRVSDDPVDDTWDDFLESCECGHHAQTSAWGRGRAFIGWTPVRVVVSREGGIVAGAQMVMRPMPFGGLYGFVCRGPAVPRDESGLLDVVLDEILALGARRGVRYLVVQPPPAGQWMEPELKRRGFRRGAFDIDHTSTVRVDLTRDLDEILAGMPKKRRQHIRSAARRGVTVRRGSADDVEVFNRLKDVQSSRLGYSRRRGDYYTELWQALEPRGHIGLFVAEYEGEPLSVQLVLPFGEVCRHMERPWSGTHAEMRPNELVEWEAMKWAKSAGYRATDLEGVPEPVAAAVVEGREIPDDPEYSASLFKLQFGGRIVVDPPSYDYVYNPVLRLCYHSIPVRVMRSAWMRRLLFRFRETGS